MKPAERWDAFASEMEKQVILQHDGRRTWSKLCGQWIVYGFERKLGFIEAVQLESYVEEAFRSKKSIKDAVIECMANLYPEN